MTVTRLWVDGQFVTVTGSGYEPDGTFLVDGQEVDLSDYSAAKTALWLGTLNNDAQLEQSGEVDGKTTYRMVGDPTEGSILVAALKAGASAKELNAAYPRKQEIPFDSDRKRMVTIHEIETPNTQDISPFGDQEKKQWYTIAVKGAPDIVLGLCAYQQTLNNGDVRLDDAARQRILDANDLMTQDALRVLGVAYRLVPVLPGEIKSEELEKDLIFVGLIGMIDPARKEVKPAMAEATVAGIRTIMITGDYPNTAKAIAQEIGLLRKGHQVLTGADINNLTDEEMIKAVEVTDVFARVSPEHKMRIVDALRANGEVVAMTGDGVNDAPAIKRADIGVSMGITGTDVAKETADMVLTDDNFATIEAAVEEGRGVFDNLTKIIAWTLPTNLGEGLIILLAIVAGITLPILPVHILWINMTTVAVLGIVLALEQREPGIMSRPPRHPHAPILTRVLLWRVALVGAMILFGAFGLFELELLRGASIDAARTVAVNTVIMVEIFYLLNCRSLTYSMFHIGLFSNRWVIVGIVAMVLLQLLFTYAPFMNDVLSSAPISGSAWARIVAVGFSGYLVVELEKWLRRRSSAEIE